MNKTRITWHRPSSMRLGIIYTVGNVMLFLVYRMGIILRNKKCFLQLHVLRRFDLHDWWVSIWVGFNSNCIILILLRNTHLKVGKTVCISAHGSHVNKYWPHTASDFHKMPVYLPAGLLFMISGIILTTTALSSMYDQSIQMALFGLLDAWSYNVLKASCVIWFLLRRSAILFSGTQLPYSISEL